MARRCTCGIEDAVQDKSRCTFCRNRNVAPSRDCALDGSETMFRACLCREGRQDIFASCRLLHTEQQIVCSNVVAAHILLGRPGHFLQQNELTRNAERCASSLSEPHAQLRQGYCHMFPGHPLDASRANRDECTSRKQLHA